jgi:hypothetical protein
MIWERGEKSSGHVQHVADFQVLPRTMACVANQGQFCATGKGRRQPVRNGSQSDGSGERYGATCY